jgi:hypothetical protein
VSPASSSSDPQSREFVHRMRVIWRRFAGESKISASVARMFRRVLNITLLRALEQRLIEYK